MDFKNILKILSLIGITLGVFFLSDILVGILYHEKYLKFLTFDTIFLFFNLSIWILLKNHKINLKIKESILTVSLLWIY